MSLFSNNSNQPSNFFFTPTFNNNQNQNPSIFSTINQPGPNPIFGNNNSLFNDNNNNNTSLFGNNINNEPEKKLNSIGFPFNGFSIMEKNVEVLFCSIFFLLRFYRHHRLNFFLNYIWQLYNRDIIDDINVYRIFLILDIF